MKNEKVWGNTFRYASTDEEFIKAVKENFSIRSTLLALGLKGGGANYKGFHRRVEELNLDTSHFTGQGHLKGKTHNWAPKYELEEILVENSPYRGGTSLLKKRLLKEGYFTSYSCDNCGISEWMGEKISLHLDHINGINNDHRIENLRLLCPNCHSQTSTYAGKNKGSGE